MSRRNVRGLSALGVVVAIALALCVGAASAAAETPARASITVDAAHAQGSVDPSVLGHAYLWPFGGMGSYDEQAGEFYPQFLSQLRDGIRPGALRYPGGITGETFHWKRSVGPQSQRTPSAFAPNQGPSQPTVGPDEFGQLLELTGARGVMTVNFATGSAQEAAELAARMRPYDIPYWEVGNEENLAKYWRGGQPVAVGGPAGACDQVITCLYIYGGSTRFTRQAAVGYADRRPEAALSTGAANQSFYVQYPPVTPDSVTVYVDGDAWTQVDDLGSAAPGAHVYTLAPQAGKVTFGDGEHGAIPPEGAKITITYVSGPHDGFLDFYRAIKAADPQAQVCSSDPTNDFIESMGSDLPYDCLEHHAYVSSGDVPDDLPIDEYQRALMAVPEQDGRRTADLEAKVRANAKRDVPLVMTEYGQLLSSNPDGYPFFHDSLDEALLNASQLAQWIRLGIPVADRQLLTAEIPPPDTPCCPGLPGAAPFATTGAIGTPGPDTVLEATGRVYRLFAPLAGQGLLPVSLDGIPELSGGGRTAAALDAVAARGGDSLYMVVINRSPSDAVDAHVDPAAFRHDDTADVSTLNAPSSLSYNTRESPDTVTVNDQQVVVGPGGFDHTFPAHSVTAIRLSGHVVSQAPDLTLRSAAPIVDAGDTTTMTATLTNHSGSTITGTLTPSGPSGWSISPATTPYELRAGETATKTFTVAVPEDSTAGSYRVSVTARGYGLTLAMASTEITVPSSLKAAFNNAGISDDSNVDGADFDGVGNSYSEQALTAAGLAPGATVLHDGIGFTWPDVRAGQLDNVVAQGQTISVHGSGTHLGFLGASSSEPTATGSGTVYYTDGTKSSYTVTLYGFFNAPPGDENDVIAELPYENSQGVGGRPRGQYDHPVYVFYTSAPVETGKTVAAVTLPSGGSTGPGRIKGMHFFAVGVG